MAEFTVKDNKTGKTVRFQWNGETDPTDSDIEAVFSAARGFTTPEAELSKDIKGMSGTEKFLVGVGKGMTDAYTGVKQRLSEAGYAAGLVPQSVLNKQNQQVESDRAIMGQLKQGSLAAKTGEFVGKMAPYLTVPGGVAGGFGARLGTAALQGGALGTLEPTTADESVAANAGLGALTGAGGSAVLSGAGKLVNAATAKTGKPFGIRQTLGEAADNPIIRKAETWLEGVPIVGLKGYRKAQQEEAQGAAREFLSKYIADPTSPDVFATNRQYASSIFEKLKAMVGKIEDQTVSPTETRNAAQSLLGRYPDIFKRFQDTQREGLIESIVRDTGAITQGYNRLRVGAMAPLSPKPISFDEMWTLRSGLGEMVGQAKKQLASGQLDRTTYAELSRLYGAANRDIEKWAGSISRRDVGATIRAANDAYKTYVVKHDLIQKAYDKAIGTVGAGEMFSPKKFSTELKKIAYKDKQIGLFKPDEIQHMTGLANVLQVVKRAGQYAENPPTGNRWGLPVILSELGGAKSILAVPYVAVARFMSGTEIGKKLAMSASKVEPNSHAMGKIVKTVYNLIPKAAAVGAMQSTQPETMEGLPSIP